ncbi:MAG: DEAD/DEAH box helicase [Gloeocapsa sp. DLM2.Bin57]|nr:MAG: DEAD/DEAH box helicase [Gloeocapsa sp. DLM2.Bin57]
MKIPVKLQELLQQEQTTLTPFIMLIGQGNVMLDCSGVESITAEQLELIFGQITGDWDFTKLTEIINLDTLSETLTNQLKQKFNPPSESEITPQTSLEKTDKIESLDIFNLRNEIIEDYRSYIESFLKIRDPKIKQFVEDELEKGELWPDPLIQLNPAYKQGKNVTELITEGILHPETKHYFTRNGTPYTFRYHQEQAFRIAHRQEAYVLTTGTGSGKSMTYVVPIFDDLLRHPEIKGVRAILVYPMNALINSQKEEFDKFLSQVPNTHIRVEQYTGQENLSKKTEIQNNPPQIILTNYVMLELMLSRTYEEKLVASADLKFLVLDELHTYRGRQGADVAILIRKLRQRCGQKLLCIGTSATMSTEGKRGDRQKTVAEVASKLFGVEVKPNNVIDETLEPSIKRPYPTVQELQLVINNQGIPPTLGKEGEDHETLKAFQNHPLSAWIEMNFGLDDEDGYLIRRTPISLSQGASQLAQETNTPEDKCLAILKQMFLWGSKTKGLAFRLHQFISQGGSVYATAENAEKRFLTLEGQYSTTGNRLLYPLVFCRECGQEYYFVHYDEDRQEVRPMLPNALDFNGEDNNIREGYLTPDEPDLWDEITDLDRLPESWFKETKREGRVVSKEYQDFIPRKLQILPQGKITTSLLKGTSYWFIPKPFLTCLNCGVVHDRKKNEFTKLTRLSSEGRSTTTTLLCLSTVNRLRQSPAIADTAQKILSFTDNRQDASLQAGHFNDFVQTSLLRSALNSALKEQKTLTHQELAQEVVAKMGLSQQDYAKQPAEYEGAPGKRRNEQVFRNLIEYRLYEDLRKGWRIVQPNLEQCGLLAIEYEGLKEICQVQEFWQKQNHPLLVQATPDQRYSIIQTVLNQLRKELVLDADLLQPEQVEKLKREVRQAIKEPWTFDEYEYLHEARWASLTAFRKGKNIAKLTPRSKIAQFLRSPNTWHNRQYPLPETEYDELIRALINALADAGYLLKDNDQVQLRIDSLIWKAEKVTSIPLDLMTSKRLQGSEETEIEVNHFFQNFYDSSNLSTQNLEGREHTGQVKNEQRQQREDSFRQGELSALFCSPTMELGIDIADLNVVHMRNVPPSPANYAQRSGRAGRSGQEALVITYAAVGSGHDQYFFKRQEQMVAGVVVPPKLELGNQDLIKSHLHSIWLAHTGLYLDNSMNQILDLEVEGYPLKETVKNQLSLTPSQLQDCFEATKLILEDLFCQQDLAKASWYNEDWLKVTLDNALISFDRGCDRWRKLYQDAVKQLQSSREVIDRSATGGTTKEERSNAEALQREAQRQIDLLVGQIKQGKNQSQLEFYPYRYFASEGFLPGYNFPRLPVRAYIPTGDEGEFISRPRVVAIREFAPQNIVYYEGSKFQLNKTRIPVRGIESAYQRVAFCPNCGYFHTGDDWLRDLCENCQTKITPDSYGNPAKLNRVLNMDTMLTRRRERITCDEEERLKYGYNITTHFRFNGGKQELATVITDDGSQIMELTYGDTANVWRINRGLKNSQERGFKLNVTTGVWGEAKTQEDINILQTEVHLLVEDTCNVLLVKPLQIPEDNSESFLASFQYALERAIQGVYKLEENELASERLGQGQYILFWEASEGGAGVLSQILEDKNALPKLAAEALDICHFTQPKESCSQACYECLLSYRNQFDHPLLNRNVIHPYLEQLLNSNIERHSQGDSREVQYQKLLAQTDPNSDFEREFLAELYQQGIKLPDAAQMLIPEVNVKPDFVYIDAKVAIFCDGSIHDHPEQQEGDRIQRENLKYDANFHVLVFRYDEDWHSKVNILNSF